MVINIVFLYLWLQASYSTSLMMEKLMVRVYIVIAGTNLKESLF